MSKPTLFEMKEKIATLAAERNAISEWLVAKLADPTAPMAEIKEKQAKHDEYEVRLNLLKAQHDEMESAQRASVAMQSGKSPDMDEKTVKIQAKAAFYRAALANKVEGKSFEALGGIPALDPTLGHGSRLLPTNMSNELVVEPTVENPMREVVRVSSITGLEEPKLLFDLEGAFDSVTDKETAREIEMEGDLVAYGRFKVKPKARVSDTIIHGSPLNIVTEIENALRSGLAANEMMRMFARNPDPAYAHMSFYSQKNALKAVTGETKQAAIASALADLPIAFRRNARIVMNAVDWFEMWRDNLNKSGTFFGDRPLELFGKPVILVDDAVDPVVGDFSYARINYDISTTYDTDKNVDTGMYSFVLTAWYDIQLRLRSAFRIAKTV